MKSMSRSSLCTNFWSKNYMLYVSYIHIPRLFLTFFCVNNYENSPACSDSLHKIKLRMRMKLKLKHNQNFYILNSIHTRVKLKKNILSINRSCYIAKGKLWISALRNSMHVSFNAFVYCMYETQQKVLVLKYVPRIETFTHCSKMVTEMLCI